MATVVIVGTGLGGYTVAREFRKLDRETPLLMVTADSGEFYSKPMLSNAFASGKTAETLANAQARQMADRLQADIRTQVTLQAIDPIAHSMAVSGERLTYGKLVLAVGADPVRLDLAGDAADAMLSVNDLRDYARFREAVSARRRVAIMGAGLIGCEFANDLCGAGYSVDVIDPATWPLPRLLPPQAGESMQRALAGAGVHWHLGRAVDRVDKCNGGYRLQLSDGSNLETDVVLSAIGLRPRTDLARQAGLSTNRGVIVSRSLQSSAADVYALGDCAEVEGLVLPYVMPIMQAGRALAATLAGEETAVTYPAMPVVVKTPAWPTVVAPPPAGTDGQWEVRSESTAVRALFRDASGSLKGFALGGQAIAEKNALTRELPPLLG